MRSYSFARPRRTISVGVRPPHVWMVSGNDGSPTAEKRVVDHLARTAVVEQRPAHALDRLLGAVDGFGVLPAARDGPERRLLAVARPVALGPHGVPARLVLPMVMTAAQRKAVLCPDDLRAHVEADRGQRVLHRAGVAAGMPDVGDGAGK